MPNNVLWLLSDRLSSLTVTLHPALPVTNADEAAETQNMQWAQL